MDLEFGKCKRQGINILPLYSVLSALTSKKNRDMDSNSINVKNDQTPISIGLNEEVRGQVAAMMQKLLADEHTIYIKTRNYHWNVTGLQFQPLHTLFEEQYTELAVHIDDLAERIRSLGFYAVGSMEQFKKMTRLEETGHLNGDAKEMLKHLLADHETIIQVLRNDLDECDRLGDMGNSDFLTALMEAHEKMAWMLRATLA
jgi:starvation-inducible DNA-binding protein